MNTELEELLKELRAYRDNMVSQELSVPGFISDIIIKWEMKDMPARK